MKGPELIVNHFPDILHQAAQFCIVGGRKGANIPSQRPANKKALILLSLPEGRGRESEPRFGNAR